MPIQCGHLFVVGDTDDVHPGLYVMCGSIIPTSVGVNPVMTISTLAERCVRLLIEDEGWNIDYDKNLNFSTYMPYWFVFCFPCLLLLLRLCFMLVLVLMLIIVLIIVLLMLMHIRMHVLLSMLMLVLV